MLATRVSPRSSAPCSLPLAGPLTSAPYARCSLTSPTFEPLCAPGVAVSQILIYPDATVRFVGVQPETWLASASLLTSTLAAMVLTC